MASVSNVLRFRDLLSHTWNHSPLYRRIWGQSGIRERDLPHVPLEDLPPVGKTEVMENFDEAVTDPRLRRAHLEAWVEQDSNPLNLYLDEYIAMYSSGGSSIRSIVPCTRRTWRRMTTSAAPNILPAGADTRVPLRSAFYYLRDGHIASSTNANLASQAGHDVLRLTLGDPVEEIWARLNAFQPEHLSTYGSNAARLAAWTLDGRLRIRPRTVLATGDRLSPAFRALIREAWGAEVSDLYASVESLYMAVRKPGDAEFHVFSDINVLEVVDSAHRMVREGTRGRVLVTNLVNLTLPLVRFDLADEAILGTAGFGAETLKAIEGKTTIRLPVRLADGDVTELPLRDLCRMDATGCNRFQFVSISPDEVELRYESSENLDSRIETAFRGLLAARGATVRSVRARRVPFIHNDGRTAKHVEVWPDRPTLPLVRLADTTDDASDSRPRVVAADSGSSSMESVFDQFRPAARRHPDRIAIEDGDGRMSYAAAEASAVRIAQGLLSRGFDPARPIAVLSSHRAQTIPLLLGVLAAGGFYLPLDPATPPERLQAILGETRPEYLLVDADPEKALRSSLDGIGTRVLDLRALTADAPEATLPRVEADTPACLLYTTGSTGAPKGVVLSHRSVGSRVAGYRRDFGIGTGDRVSLLQPFAVSAAVRDIFGALLGGATLAVYDVRARGVEHLAGWVRSQGITVLYAVPTLWRLFLEILSAESFPDVRLVRLGGEPVEPRDLAGFRRHFPEGCRFVNGYAATETDTVCHYVMDHQTRLSASRVPVGRPVTGMEVDICDDAGLAILDAIGEIRAAGDSLAYGLWDPLARRVRPLPAGPVGTGDLGFRLPDGRIVLTGRRDFTVKIHGYRVDLTVIERAVASITGEGEAVAVAGPTPTGDTGIAVYYVPGAASEPEAIRRVINAVLPASNLPISLVPVSALPRLPGGKVLRHVLSTPRPAAVAPRPAADYRNAIEAKLAAIWADQLGIGAVSRDADFFDLGGDSVTAIRAINRIRQDFDIAVSVSEFFDHSTVAGLARLIER